MGQHHDSAPSLNYTVISIDSPHMRKDGSNYLKFLFTFLIAMHNGNEYKYYGIGPIILGKFDRSCLIWVYGFQLYLFTGKSIDFERNRMAPEIWNGWH